MVKPFLLAKSFYRYCALIFRDHRTSRNLAGWIPGGVCTPVIVRASRRHQPSTADVPIPRCETEPHKGVIDTAKFASTAKSADSGGAGEIGEARVLTSGRHSWLR